MRTRAVPREKNAQARRTANGATPKATVYEPVPVEEEAGGGRAQSRPEPPAKIQDAHDGADGPQAEDIGNHLGDHRIRRSKSRSEGRHRHQHRHVGRHPDEHDRGEGHGHEADADGGEGAQSIGRHASHQSPGEGARSVRGEGERCASQTQALVARERDDVHGDHEHEAALEQPRHVQAPLPRIEERLAE